MPFTLFYQNFCVHFTSKNTRNKIIFKKVNKIQETPGNTPEVLESPQTL
jgi:hypothetical protein